MIEPQAPRIEQKIKFGYDQNEFKGDKKLLINPPFEMTDYYNWLQNDIKSYPKILKYLEDENKYFNDIMKDTESLQNKLNNEFFFEISN